MDDGIRQTGRSMAEDNAAGEPEARDTERWRTRQQTICSFVLNGDPVTVGIPAHWTLLEALRYLLGLTGTKQGCDKGDCGACTVRIDGDPVLACLTLALEVEGRRVDTVEGLGTGAALHPLQIEFADRGAAQCGFCTPGILMSAAAFLDERHAAGATELGRDEIAAAIGGNLCRCTGYTKILDAIEAAFEGTRP